MMGASGDALPGSHGSPEPPDDLGWQQGLRTLILPWCVMATGTEVEREQEGMSQP